MNWLTRFFQPKATDSSRFNVLADDIADLKRRMKSIELDWEQTYDKVSHLMARVTKRQKALDRDREQLELQESAGQDAPGATNGNAAGGQASGFLGMHGRLSEARKRVFGGR